MLTKHAALAVYKSTISSFLDYNILFYSSARKSFQNKFQVLQNKAIRIICKLPKRSNLDDHHIKLNIWHVHNRYWHFLMKYTYTQSLRSDGTALDTRTLPTRMHAGRPFVLTHRSSPQYIKSFIYIERSMWNRLPPEIQTIPSLEQFSAFLRNVIRRKEAELS